MRAPVLALCLLLVGGALTGTRAEEAPVPRAVVVLSSWFKELPWAAAFQRGFAAEIAESGTDISVGAEYLDAGRFPDEARRQVAEAFFQREYGLGTTDVVVAESIPAIGFLRSRPDLFPGARRVYIQTGAFAEALAKTDMVRAEVDYRIVLEEIERLRAPKRYVLANAGEADGSARRLAALKAALADIAPDRPVEIWEGVPLRVMRERVAELTAEDAVFLLPIFTDGEGRRMTPKAVAGQLAQVSGAPLFTAWETMLGNGVVGGAMLSGERVGRMAADRVLHPDTTGDPKLTPIGFFYDWRQLERWGISRDQLPEDAVIRFRPPPFYERYLWEIVVAACMGLLLLSLALFVRREAGGGGGGGRD